jgi:hypothetical protein
MKSGFVLARRWRAIVVCFEMARKWRADVWDKAIDLKRMQNSARLSSTKEFAHNDADLTKYVRGNEMGKKIVT